MCWRGPRVRLPFCHRLHTCAWQDAIKSQFRPPWFIYSVMCPISLGGLNHIIIIIKSTKGQNTDSRITGHDQPTFGVALSVPAIYVAKNRGRPLPLFCRRRGGLKVTNNADIWCVCSRFGSLPSIHPSPVDLLWTFWVSKRESSAVRVVCKVCFAVNFDWSKVNFGFFDGGNTETYLDTWCKWLLVFDLLGPSAYHQSTWACRGRAGVGTYRRNMTRRRRRNGWKWFISQFGGLQTNNL